MAEARIDRHSAVVEQDLPDIYTFIAEHDPAAAERVLDAVEETFRQLARYPDCGVSYPTRNRKLRRLRMFPVSGFPNYLVFYRVETRWDDQLAAEDSEYRKLRSRDEKRVHAFLKKYFSLKAKAALKTQMDVAKAAGLERTHVTALESGQHMPQQKTLQKLANAFGVDVIDLM